MSWLLRVVLCVMVWCVLLGELVFCCIMLKNVNVL